MERIMFKELMSLLMSKAAPLEAKNIFEGPFSEKEFEIHSTKSITKYYFKGNLNDKNCGNGVFSLIKKIEAHTSLDKTAYASHHKEKIEVIGEYRGRVKFGKMFGNGTYISKGHEIPAWILDSQVNNFYYNNDCRQHTIKGYFKDNFLNGSAEYLIDNNLRYSGNFIDGKPIGIGAAYFENNMQLKINVNDFNEYNKQFEAAIYENNKLIFKGNFISTSTSIDGSTDGPFKNIISGIYYHDDTPYKFNEFFEFELPDGIYKLERIFWRAHINGIYGMNFKIIKFDRNLEFQKWFDYFKDSMIASSSYLREYRKNKDILIKYINKIQNSETVEEFLGDDELLINFFHKYLKDYKLRNCPLNTSRFYKFINEYNEINN